MRAPPGFIHEKYSDPCGRILAAAAGIRAAGGAISWICAVGLNLDMIFDLHARRGLLGQFHRMFLVGVAVDRAIQRDVISGNRRGHVCQGRIGSQLILHLSLHVAA